MPRLHLVDQDQPRPVAPDLVDRLQQLCDVDLLLRVRQDALEGRDRLGVFRFELEDLGVSLDGATELGETLLAQHAQADE